MDRLAEGRALLFWCREPDETLTWVFPRHHRMLLLREARTAKSVIRGTSHLVTNHVCVHGGGQMEVVYERCCGLDIHKKTVVACVVVPGPGKQAHKEIRTFNTMSADLLELADWLTAMCSSDLAHPWLRHPLRGPRVLRRTAT